MTDPKTDPTTYVDVEHCTIRGIASGLADLLTDEQMADLLNSLLRCVDETCITDRGDVSVLCRRLFDELMGYVPADITGPIVARRDGPPKPKWRLVANLADPERVGNFQEAINVYVDTGTDLPEIEFIEYTEIDEHKDEHGVWRLVEAWLVTRFAMPKHTCTNLTGGSFFGGLYPNLDDDKAIKDRALGGDGSGNWSLPTIPIQTMVEWFTSDDPLERAKGYMALAEMVCASEFGGGALYPYVTEDRQTLKPVNE